MSNPNSDAVMAPITSARALVGPLAAIIVGMFMVILDTTAVNVALPVLGEDFGRDISVLQWTLTGYALAQAAVIPLAGWLSDRFGAKQIFIVSIVLFTIGSLLCALANTAEQLIVYRVVQGLGGGMVMPIAFAITFRISPPEKVGSIMGLMGIPVLLAPAIGPMVAGYLVDYVSWHWIFIINLPIGIFGILLCLWQLPKIPKSASTALDVLGILIGPLAFAGLSYGISEGGGMVMPIAFAITFRISPPEKVGSIMGLMGIPVLLAPAIGPMVAGYLVDYVSWHWIFIINLPIGIFGILLCLWQLPKIPKSASTALDVLGILIGPLAFAGLSYGISEGGESWSSDKTVIGLAVGICALLAFIAVELLRKQQPLLELRVFRSLLFTRGIIVQWVLQFVMFGVIFMIPYFMQMMMGMDAFHAGLWSLPQALAASLFMPIGGRLYDRIGVRPLVIAGITLVITGAYLISRIDPDQSAWLFFIPRALFGMGAGLSFLPLNTYLIHSAPSHLVSRVTSLTSAAQQIMVSLSVAVLTTIVASRTRLHVEGGMKPMPDAMTAAYHDAYLMLAGIAVVGLLLGITLRKPAASDAASKEFVATEM